MKFLFLLVTHGYPVGLLALIVGALGISFDFTLMGAASMFFGGALMLARWFFSSVNFQ